jgi:hypothetical protein
MQRTSDDKTVKKKSSGTFIEDRKFFVSVTYAKQTFFSSDTNVE